MKIFLFLTIALLSAHIMHAQSIKGIVVDANKQGIPSISIKLLNKDSTFVTGTTTDNNGTTSSRIIKWGNIYFHILV